MSKTAQADGRVASRTSNYAKFWQKEAADDGEVDVQNRLISYEDVVNGYYDGATELYEYGWAESFHFCRFYPGEAFRAGLARHEHYLSSMIGLKAGMKVLDVGCGIGGPAREIARFSDANIIGVSLNDFQIGRARKYTKQAGLQNQVQFQQGNFMELSKDFGENSFDAVYAIEATVHAPTFEGIYSEIFKVLKPGGVAGIYEWVMTEKYDASNPAHKAIAHNIEIGDGIAEMRTAKQARDAFKSSGFEILVDEDMAERDDKVDWFYPLEGDVRKAQTPYDILTCLRTSKLGQTVTHNAVWGLEKMGLVPKGTHEVGETLRLAADALVAGGQQGLFTPMHLFIVRKPDHI